MTRATMPSKQPTLIQPTTVETVQEQLRTLIYPVSTTYLCIARPNLTAAPWQGRDQAAGRRGNVLLGTVRARCRPAGPPRPRAPPRHRSRFEPVAGRHV